MIKSETFKPKSDFVWGTIGMSFAILYLIQSALYPTGNWFDFALAFAVAGAVFLVWLRPRLELRESDLVVINPLSSRVINYRDIVELETRWALRIVHKNGSTRVWVAPASGKHRWIAESTTKWSSDRLPTNASKTVEFTSMSKSHLSDSGAAALLIQQRLESNH
jgi:hypothetical protein